MGTAIGVAAATALSVLLTALLFGVSGHDPLTFTPVPAALVAAAFAGAYLPARRASAVDLSSCSESEVRHIHSQAGNENNCFNHKPHDSRQLAGVSKPASDA